MTIFLRPETATAGAPSGGSAVSVGVQQAGLPPLPR
jgi:hypothetical protein